MLNAVFSYRFSYTKMRKRLFDRGCRYYMVLDNKACRIDYFPVSNKCKNCKLFLNILLNFWKLCYLYLFCLDFICCCCCWWWRFCCCCWFCCCFCWFCCCCCCCCWWWWSWWWWWLCMVVVLIVLAYCLVEV